MPRYDYECSSCGSVTEHLFSMASKPEVVPCECGGECRSLITGGSTVLVKGVAWEIPFDKRCMPIGWQHGNTDAAAQERRYGRMIDEQRKVKQTGDFRMKARIPRELYNARVRQTGNKNYWTEEGDTALKRDGLLLGGS